MCPWLCRTFRLYNFYLSNWIFILCRYQGKLVLPSTIPVLFVIRSSVSTRQRPSRLTISYLQSREYQSKNIIHCKFSIQAKSTRQFSLIWFVIPLTAARLSQSRDDQQGVDWTFYSSAPAQVSGLWPAHQTEGTCWLPFHHFCHMAVGGWPVWACLSSLSPICALILSPVSASSLCLSRQQKDCPLTLIWT